MTSQNQILRPFGPPIGKYEIPFTLLNAINQLIDEGDENHLYNLSNRLAGQITQEVGISSEICQKLGIADFLANIVQDYIKQTSDKSISEFVLLNVWVVRQFSGDYNPIHWHSGHISGAGWLKVPTKMTISDKKEGKPRNKDGCITYTHGSHQFLSRSTYTLIPKEGQMTVFPHYLMHSVYPFSTEGERRSLAFNAKIDDQIFDVYGYS